MMEREITSPNSQEGIDCCLNCELAKCEMESTEGKMPGGIIHIRKQQAKQLYFEGKLSVVEIAEQLGVSQRTITRYVNDQ
jgi:response regulator of citrate/malate metabolism